MPENSPRVGLFVTCLVDMFRPSVGFAAVKLLEDAGCTVEVPEAQTCCGQPAFNAGLHQDAIALVPGQLGLVLVSDAKGAPHVVDGQQLRAPQHRRGVPSRTEWS